MNIIGVFYHERSMYLGMLFRVTEQPGYFMMRLVTNFFLVLNFLFLILPEVALKFSTYFPVANCKGEFNFIWTNFTTHLSLY